MASTSKKRAATEPVEPATKKQRNGPANTGEIEEEYESVQITAELHDKFALYPKALREAVENDYTNDIYKIIAGFQSGQERRKKSTFHIVRGAHTQGGDESDYRLTQAEVYYSASMANVAVLEQFLKLAPSKKAEYVKAPDVGLTNPGYAALHSVPHGHLGWGWDALGCLSVHKTVVQKNRLKHAYAYVEHKEVNMKTDE